MIFVLNVFFLKKHFLRNFEILFCKKLLKMAFVLGGGVFFTNNRVCRVFWKLKTRR